MAYARRSDVTVYARRSDVRVYAQRSDVTLHARRSDVTVHARGSDVTVYARRSDVTVYDRSKRRECTVKLPGQQLVEQKVTDRVVPRTKGHRQSGTADKRSPTEWYRGHKLTDRVVPRTKAHRQSGTAKKKLTADRWFPDFHVLSTTQCHLKTN